MDTKRSRILTFLGVLVIGVALIVGCAGGARETPGPEEPTVPEESPSPQLSEQPDEAVFKEYFTDIGLGIMLPEGEFPKDLKRNITVFAPTDRICVYGTVIKEVWLWFAIYDTEAKEFAHPKWPSGGHRALQEGSFAESAGALPVGNYEYKVYEGFSGDVLVAVLPFEVQE